MDDVDEFVAMMMHDYDSKPFKSAQQSEDNIDTEEEKQHKQQLTEDNKDLLEKMKEVLKDKVNDVIISSKLKSHPVCLTAQEGVSMEMEKTLSKMPDGGQVKASKVLEINPDHDIFKTLQKVYQKDAGAIDDYADILYQQALLIEGFPVDDPVEFSNKICKLIMKTDE